jgi:hypothetical protein
MELVARWWNGERDRAESSAARTGAVRFERRIPGGVAQSERDADTFFATDLPALLDWRFGAAEARRISQPVVYVGGSHSSP